MSEFRLFCLSAFIGSGIFSAFMNHVVKAPPLADDSTQALTMLFVFGCLGVAVFGKRAAQ